jgi:hypothetical protein
MGRGKILEVACMKKIFFFIPPPLLFEFSRYPIFKGVSTPLILFKTLLTIYRLLSVTAKTVTNSAIFSVGLYAAIPNAGKQLKGN